MDAVRKPPGFLERAAVLTILAAAGLASVAFCAVALECIDGWTHGRGPAREWAILPAGLAGWAWLLTLDLVCGRKSGRSAWDWALPASLWAAHSGAAFFPPTVFFASASIFNPFGLRWDTGLCCSAMAALLAGGIFGLGLRDLASRWAKDDSNRGDEPGNRTSRPTS